MNKEIIRNIKIHDKIANSYNHIHKEIFNNREQLRLKRELFFCQKYIQVNLKFAKAFDFGCGSGNLTNHLLEMGLNVVAADVSKKFLN